MQGIEDYLTKQGLIFEPKNGQLVLDCPFCLKKNKLHIGQEDVTKEGVEYKAGSWGCFTCPEKGDFNRFKKRYSEVQETEGQDIVNPAIVKEFSMEQVLAYHSNLNKYAHVQKYIQNKKLKKEVVDKLLWGANELGDLTIPHIYKGKVYGIRLVHFYNGVKSGVSMITGSSPIVLNQEFLDTNPPEVLLVEGEPDYAAALSYGIEEVISVPGVAYRKGNWIPKLKKLKTVFICFDQNDKTDAGQKAAYELADRIGKETCRNVLLPRDDLNDCLQAGLSFDTIKDVINKAKKFPLAGTSSAQEFHKRMRRKILKPGELKGARCGLGELDNIMSGWPEGKFILIAGYPKAGKTSFASYICYKLALKNKPVYLFSLETDPEDLIVNFMVNKADKPYIDFTSEDYDLRLAEVEDIPIHFYDREKETVPLSKNRLFQIIKENRDRYGIKYVLLDDIEKLTAATKMSYGKTELFHVNQILEDLFNICRDLNVSLITIVHVAKPKDDDGSKMPRALKIKGSIEIVYKADYALMLHRDVEAVSEEVQRRVKLKVSYNRPTGKTGIIDLRYDVELAKFLEV